MNWSANILKIMYFIKITANLS